MSGGTTLRWCGLRWLLDSPLLLATWCSFAFGLMAVVAVAAALRRAELVRAEVAGELARLAAEAAAIEFCAGDATRARVNVGDFEVRAVQRGPVLALAARSADDELWRFECQRLQGAAPDAFAQRLVTTDAAAALRIGEGRVVAATCLPQLDDEVLATAPRADAGTGFRLDPALSLLHWQGGTEEPDFVFDRFGQADWTVPANGVVVVPGHLWFAPHVGNYRWRLERDVVVVVEGNLYVGAGATLEGPGRAVFVTRIPAGNRPFADKDGNGRWSPGDEPRGGAFTGVLEGGGNVYLGLPGQRNALSVAAGVIAAGEVHLSVEVRLDGPLVLAAGLTALADRASLRLSGERLFNVQRERVPGFRTQGPPRPGLLQLVERRSARAVDEVDGELPLYVASSGR